MDHLDCAKRSGGLCSFEPDNTKATASEFEPGFPDPDLLLVAEKDVAVGAGEDCGVGRLVVFDMVIKEGKGGFETVGVCES